MTTAATAALTSNHIASLALDLFYAAQLNAHAGPRERESENHTEQRSINIILSSGRTFNLLSLTARKPGIGLR